MYCLYSATVGPDIHVYLHYFHLILSGKAKLYIIIDTSSDCIRGKAHTRTEPRTSTTHAPEMNISVCCGVCKYVF